MRSRDRRAEVRSILAPALAALVAMATAAWTIRPFRAGQVGFDTAASVLYFERLASGRLLEAFVPTTPKPLVTLLAGLAYEPFHDWRVVSWVAIALYGASIAAAWILLRRIGGTGAAAFGAAALVGSTGLLYDVSLAYAVNVALLGWLVAGLAMTGDRPRPLIAGVALLLAALARTETLILLALIGGLLLAAALLARVRGTRPPARASFLLLVGLLALPIGFTHDWLLTRDPLYMFSVPAVVSVGAPLMSPAAVVGRIVRLLAAAPPLTILAGLGIAVLVRRRSWPLLVGLVAGGPGVTAFLVLLAVRGIYISNRYLAPLELSLAVAAAVGFGSLRVVLPAVRPPWVRGASSTLRPLLVILAGVVCALAVLPTVAPLDRPLTRTIRENLRFQRNADAAIELIRRELGSLERMPVAPPGPHVRADPRRAMVRVPFLVGARTMVDLGLDATDVAANRTPDSIGRSVLVYHDRIGDEPVDAFGWLEVDRPTDADALRVEPLRADPTAGSWILRVTPIP